MMSKVFEVEASLIRNLIYFSYKGYHPFVETLKEYEQNKKLRYRDSVLYKYYILFNPENLSQVLFETDEIKPLVPVDKFIILYPWSTKRTFQKGEKGLPVSCGSQHFGPVTEQKGLLEFKRLTTLYDSIKEYGYKPESHNKGYYLKRGSEQIFLLTAGHHRTAVMAALEYKKIKVAFQSRVPKIVDIENIKDWTQVQNGTFDIETARKIFNRFFDEDGRGKAKRIGLLEG